MPTSVDLSPWLPAAGDQGHQNACIAWAVAYGMRSYQEAGSQDPIGNGGYLVLSPAFAFNMTKHEFDTTDVTCLGTWFDRVFSVLVEQGCCTWQSMPYDTARSACFAPIPEGAIQQASEFRMAPPLRVNTQDTDQIRYHLATRSTVAFGLAIDTAFKYGGLRAGRDGTPFLWAHPGTDPPPGCHALLLAGYDDSDSTFLFLNSWGTRWGRNGYGKVSYATFRQWATEAYVALDALPDASNAMVGPDAISNAGDGSRHRAKVREGEGMGFNDLHIGVLDIHPDPARVNLVVSDRDRDSLLHRIDLREDRPVQFYHEGQLITLEYTRTSRTDRPAETRVHLRARREANAKDVALEVALQQADRIREGRKVGGP